MRATRGYTKPEIVERNFSVFLSAYEYDVTLRDFSREISASLESCAGFITITRKSDLVAFGWVLWFTFAFQLP